jgi:hypothetical protein
MITNFKTICMKHSVIIQDAQKITKLTNNLEILKLVENILDEAKQAKNDGIRMEKGLHKYRNTIEKLGFKRIHT